MVGKYKAGDKVVLGKHPSDWASEMDQYVGKVATLVVGRYISRWFVWNVDIDNGRWFWHEENFDQVRAKHK